MKKPKEKKVSKDSPIEWEAVKVKAKQLNATPDNYKILNELGKERFLTSLGMFGRAGTVVCNLTKDKKKFDLIDGNSRWEDQMAKDPEKLMWISVPNRRLTPKEYKEMCAMYDAAVAGDIDVQRIHKDLGTSKDWYLKWGYEPPMDLLNGMGSKVNKADLAFPDKAGKGKGVMVMENDVCMVQLFFTVKQEKEYRVWEEKAFRKFKTDDTTTLIYKLFKSTKV